MQKVTVRDLKVLLEDMNPDAVVGSKHEHGITINFKGVSSEFNLRAWDHPSIEGNPDGPVYVIEIPLDELKTLKLHLGEKTYEKLKSGLMENMTNQYFNKLIWRSV